MKINQTLTHVHNGLVCGCINRSSVDAVWVTHDKPLETVKVESISKVRKGTNTHILGQYPVYKQLNRSLAGAMTAEEITDMDTFINECRTVCNSNEASIEAATTAIDVISSVDAITLPVIAV